MVLRRKVFNIKENFRGLTLKLNRRSIVLAIFVVVAFGLSLAVNVSGFSFFGPAKTHVQILYGKEKLDFFSTKKTLSEALSEEGITIFPQDKTELVLNTALSGKAVKGAIDHSLPVAIFDGYKKIMGRSTSVDPTQILADNNIKVYPEDKSTAELLLDPVSSGAVGVAVRIQRAPTYFVAIDGVQITVRSWNPTVSEVLAQSKAMLNPQDEVSPAKTDRLLPGDVVTVTRVNEIDLSVIQAVPYESETTTSAAVAFGESRVIQAGSNGEINKTYHVVYKNGVEVSRWLISTAVTKPVQNKITARGSISGRANFGYYSGMSTSFYQGYKGHHLLVTNLQNGKQVTVEIIGSGPFNGPLMDMGTEPFAAIGGSTSTGYLPSVSVVLLD